MEPLVDKTLSASILIVDDNENNVKLLELMLAYAGYTNVKSTTDSRDVKGLFQQHTFDLILLDIRMPHLNGFEVMEQLSHEIQDDYLPVLVLTAQQDMDTRLRALEAGAKDFVTKPFDKSEVLNRIVNMLEVRFLYNDRVQQKEILEEKVKERTEELIITQKEIVRRLSRAGEYRDNETGMHVIRMSVSSKILALAAGKDQAYGELIVQASPMHDVGKIGIPDHILLKPGKFEPEEWEIMKTHVEIGADIIGDHGSELMQMASSIAMTHHEKWDGSGYPNGLKGENIPFAGRVCAICDVFDALTSSRPYKKAWTVEKAIALINEEAGRHFDPELVVLFNEILPEVLEIREKYADKEE